MSTLERIKLDPRVESVWDEGMDGVWISLKDGFKDGFTDGHTIHEWFLEDLYDAVKSIEPCTCKDCQKAEIKKQKQKQTER